MAFIFPEDKATFTAPNGITYAWKDDHWVVQKFKGDHEVYVSPTPPNNPEEGKLWYDSSGDVIELFIYVDDAWVSATPNSEYALESRIAQNEQGIRDLWSDQTRQDFEISGLDNRVEALEGVVGQYKYVIQTANQTPRNGELAFLKGDMSTTTRWGDATNISVNPTSGSGEVWPTDEIVTGDVLRFHLKGDITMEVSAFEAKVVQNNNNLFGIDTVVKEVGTIMDGAEYEVYHLSSFDPSGLATMDYVDAQDANIKAYSDSKDDEVKQYVDEEIAKVPTFDESKLDRYLPLSGGEMQGTLLGKLIKSDRTTGYAFEVKPGNSETVGYWNTSGAMRLYPNVTGSEYCFAVYATGLGDNKSAFRITADGKVKAGHDTSSPFLATSANDIVTKAYFDSNAVTAKPAQLSWKYAGDKGGTTETPSSGYFNKSTSSGKIYLRFSYQTFNGVDLGDGKFDDTNVNLEYGPIGTIWVLMSNGKWKLRRQFRADTWRWNYLPSGSLEPHFEFGLSSSHGHDWSFLANGTEYFITVGGFF